MHKQERITITEPISNKTRNDREKATDRKKPGVGFFTKTRKSLDEEDAGWQNWLGRGTRKREAMKMLSWDSLVSRLRKREEKEKIRSAPKRNKEGKKLSRLGQGRIFWQEGKRKVGERGGGDPPLILDRGKRRRRKNRSDSTSEGDEVRWGGSQGDRRVLGGTK